LGTILRSLASLSWAASGLAYACIDKPMIDMRFYLSTIGDALERTDLISRAAVWRTGTGWSPSSAPCRSSGEMSTMTARCDDGARLDQILGEIIPGLRGQRVAIRAIHRRSSGASTSYDTDVVTVQLATGEDFRVFLKDYAYSRIHKDGMEGRRERELCVYRD